MPIRDTLLVKYQGGYFEETSVAHGARRREGSLSVNVLTRGEASQVAKGMIVLLRDPQEQITATIEPVGATDRPYVDFLIGDLVTVPDRVGADVLARVVGLTVTSDEEGNPVFVPELDLGHDDDLGT